MYNFKLDSGFSIDLEKDDKVFTPTGTSKVLVEAIIENVKEKKKFLILDVDVVLLDYLYLKTILLKSQFMHPI